MGQRLPDTVKRRAFPFNYRFREPKRARPSQPLTDARISWILSQVEFFENLGQDDPHYLTLEFEECPSEDELLDMIDQHSLQSHGLYPAFVAVYDQYAVEL